MSPIHLEVLLGVVTVTLAAVAYLLASSFLSFIAVTLGAVGLGLLLGRVMNAAGR